MPKSWEVCHLSACNCCHIVFSIKFIRQSTITTACNFTWLSRCVYLRVCVEIWAKPSDINVLDEYSRDPRVVTNLIDGVNRTQDDTHMWLAPFTAGQSHHIFLQFHQHVYISVLRIWVCTLDYPKLHFQFFSFHFFQIF